MMTHAVSALRLSLCLAMLSAGPAFAQFPSPAESHDDDSRSVAYVYVQTLNGIDVYRAAFSGKLKLVSGSPFSTAGDLIGSTGKYVISLDTDIPGTANVGMAHLHSYPVAANGAIGAQAAQIDTSTYAGGSCGQTSAGVLDRTSQYVQVLYNPSIYVSSPCTTYQTFALANTSGAFTFLGDAVVNPDISAELDPIAITGNNQFAYALDTDVFSAVYAGFIRESNGALANLTFSETDPPPPPPFEFFAWLVAADPANHLAMALGSLEFFGSPLVTVGPTRLASYTVDASGNIASTNTPQNMPVPDVGPTLMRISPSGTLLAVAGGPCNWCSISVLTAQDGLEVFHFNGADPITPFTGVLTTDPIDQLEWDNNNHLFALSDSANKLYVFTATPSGFTQAPGSPYTVANPNGVSPNGMAVVPIGRHRDADMDDDSREDP